MKLEVNKNHKKANLTGRKLLTKAALLIGGVAVTVSSLVVPAYAESLGNSYSNETQSAYVQTYNDNDEVEIDDFNIFSVASEIDRFDDGPITVGDLKSITDYLIIKVDPSKDLDISWLNYCENLKIASVISYGPVENEFASVKGLKSLESISIFCIGYDTLDEEGFAFLRNCPNLKTITVNGMAIDNDFLESLPSVETLEVFVQNDLELELDYSRLTHLKALDFTTTKPYDIAVNFSSRDYDLLVSSGVSVEGDYLEEAMTVSKELDSITDSLPITDDMTDEEKLDQVLIYVLERLSYDKEISDAIKSGTDHDALTKSFYEKGALYGALAKDSSICGNYSALVDALLYRLGMKSAIVVNDDHAWNLVQVEGEYYYVDSTFLDAEMTWTEGTPVEEILPDGRKVISYSYTNVNAADAIREGKTDDLTYRMFDPTVEIDVHHEDGQYPSYIEVAPLTKETTPETFPNLVPIKSKEEVENERKEQTQEEKAEDITDKKFKIHLGTKEYIIGGGVLVGLAAGAGAAILVKKKKEEEKRRRRMQEQMWDSPYSYDDPYSFTRYR